ncbi:MAG: hypothetical protein CMJ18_05735 [Phycisphaeraceae bacterium]|nr:hypothetical protein [Phycisphaeraceae bacterium]
MHFCTLAGRRSDQVFEPLAASPGIAMASTQFGFEYYVDHLDELRGRLAIEALYGDAHDYICRKHGTFRDWALDFVPRFKDESGLILFLQAPSVEAARALWDTWEQAHRR